jgi:uncharacterized membrane protein (DUF106 family)
MMMGSVQSMRIFASSTQGQGGIDFKTYDQWIRHRQMLVQRMQKARQSKDSEMIERISSLQAELETCQELFSKLGF